MSKRLRIKPTSIDVIAKDRMVLASPRKVNLVTELIRGRKAKDALDVLNFCKKAAAVDVKKTVASAISNAEMNFNLDADKLIVKEAYVGKAVTLRRFLARAKGSGSRLKKVFSHLTIIVCEAEV